MRYSILHITDLHLNDFEGTSEHLRRTFYEEYIDDLVVEIKKLFLRIDCIIISGDLVDRGTIENYPNVGIIIDYLADQINVPTTNIYFCIGNHDFKYKEENEDASNSHEVRNPYYKFIEKYGKGILFENERVTLSKVEEKIFYMSIDSTLGSNAKKLKGKPGNISQYEIDKIIKDVLKKYLTSGSLLMIGCHYPIIPFPSGLVAIDEDNWEEKHLWKSANSLRIRINKIKDIHKVWFMGDCHIPDHINFEESYFIMTGRFGGTTDVTSIKYVSHIPRQCKILAIDLSLEDFPIYTLNFDALTHKENPNLGKWTTKSSTVRVINPTNHEILVDAQSETSLLNLISEDIEERIISRIQEYGLYTFGRFITSNENTSLGWININLLLNSVELLSSIVSKSFDFIEEHMNLDYSKSILVGIDFWGTIIGSQLSVRTGMRNFALPTRGFGQYHSNFETSNMDLEHQFNEVNSVLFIIDVISCGDTLNRLVEYSLSKNNKLKFYVISIISNHSTIKSENFSKITTAATFCEKLRIPVINNNLLPSEDILSANINLSSKS